MVVAKGGLQSCTHLGGDAEEVEYIGQDVSLEEELDPLLLGELVGVLVLEATYILFDISTSFSDFSAAVRLTLHSYRNHLDFGTLAPSTLESRCRSRNRGKR